MSQVFKVPQNNNEDLRAGSPILPTWDFVAPRRRTEGVKPWRPHPLSPDLPSVNLLTSVPSQGAPPRGLLNQETCPIDRRAGGQGAARWGRGGGRGSSSDMFEMPARESHGDGWVWVGNDEIREECMGWRWNNVGVLGMWMACKTTRLEKTPEEGGGRQRGRLRSRQRGGRRPAEAKTRECGALGVRKEMVQEM